MGLIIKCKIEYRSNDHTEKETNYTCLSVCLLKVVSVVLGLSRFVGILQRLLSYFR